MTVTVTPDKFTMVSFDAAEIAAITQKLLDHIGVPDLDVQIKVDETSPLGRTQVVSQDPVVIEAESGNYGITPQDEGDFITALRRQIRAQEYNWPDDIRP